MKIKVGNLYKIKEGGRKGNIIRITEEYHQASVDDVCYKYEKVSGPREDLGVRFWGKSFFAERLEPVSECIVIYRKGNEVIALNKVDGLKAVARCNPKDKFDFKTGAKLAFQRLVGEETVEPDNNLSEAAKAFRLLVNALLKEGFTSTEAIRIAIGIATSETKEDN